ncbi:Chemoreceptor glutamine deamidase CheD [Anatilimnocola aggregata]|uniref:Probable chemoreceptor glutamine deamidase CheD n=2 Tax=Anatilimnocola aggregata TaxID=2528021 RepID=A0A517YK28_9BACT|nr:Chemoreceptor glutamine deamidase CheD [Anatilimnocola aggregata]
MGKIVLASGPDSITTVLGSCVGVAIYHPRTHHAMLAHVVLPASSGRASLPGKFADTAIPDMLQQLASLGICDNSLIVKLAGGSNMFGLPAGPMQVGESNLVAVEAALTKAKLRVASRHVGGNKGRRVTFDCQTGVYRIEVVGAEVVIL